MEPLSLIIQIEKIRAFICKTNMTRITTNKSINKIYKGTNNNSDKIKKITCKRQCMLAPK